MKAPLILLMLGAIALLWFDDSAKRTDLTQAEARAQAAEQQAQATAQQLQQIETQRNDLQLQLNRFTNAGSPDSAPVSPSASAPTPVPQWFQNRLNGAPTVLDPAKPPVQGQ